MTLFAPDPGPVPERGRSLALLRALAANPAGLSTSELALKCTGSAASQTTCYTLLRRQEALGRVRRAGSGPGGRGHMVVWKITKSGSLHAELGGIPAAVESCVLALVVIARPASAAQIRAWLESEGESWSLAQLYDSMSKAARKPDPLLERAGRGLWRLTARGDALLAED